MVSGSIELANVRPDITQYDVHCFALAHGSDEALRASHAWNDAKVDFWLQTTP